MPNMYRIGVTLALAGFIFAVDLVLPLGVAIGVPYVAVVFMAVRSVQVKNGLWVTGICSMLILLGYTLSTKDGPVWVGLVNCYVAIFAIWVTAIASWQWKRTEQALKAANDSLERESQAKSQILATVTHELRTPLTSVMGYTHMMLQNQDTVGQLNQTQQTYLEIISHDSLRLKQLIEDLLHVAEIESGILELNRNELSVRDEIEDVLRNLQPQFAEKQISVALDVCPDLGPLSADSLRFSQIITNLVSNAYKYSPAGTDITITAKNHNVGQVRIDVADMGVGISPDDQSRLFSKFFRVDNARSRKVYGSGLGLFITKQLVEAHGGSIWVESEEGKGSTFSVVLPGQTGGNDLKFAENQEEGANTAHREDGFSPDRKSMNVHV